MTPDWAGAGMGFLYVVVGLALAFIACRIVWEGFLAMLTHLFF